MSELPQTRPELDGIGCHAVIREGWCTAISPHWNGLPTGPAKPAPPWGDWGDLVGQLIWIARAGFRPWFPSAEERDAAWREAHAEQAAAMAQQQQRHWAAHAQ